MLWMRMFETQRKRKLRMSYQLKISTQFPVTQGVTWKETADEGREITQLEKFRMRKKNTKC